MRQLPIQLNETQNKGLLWLVLETPSLSTVSDALGALGGEGPLL